MKKTAKRIYAFFESRPKTDLIFVCVSLALYGTLALSTISQYSIWFDEAFSAYIIQFNFLDIARYTATDVHPPLFYWLLKIWQYMFGHSEIGLRSMSVFFGAIAAIFGYLFVRRQFGRKAAIFGLFILSISPLFIRYSQEARMYTLAAAIVMAATYVLTRAIASKGRKLWFLYGFLVALGMWTHYFTALAWLAHWVWRYFVVKKPGLKGKALCKTYFDRNWLTAYVFAVAVFVPWVPAMVIQLVVVQSNGFWIGPVGVDTPTNYFGTLVYFLGHGQVTGWLALGLLGMAIVTAILSMRTYKRGSIGLKRNYILLLALSAVPPILLFLISLPPLTSSFVERYVLPAATASAFFMGVTLAYGLKGVKIWKQIVVFAVIIAMLIYGLSNIYWYGNYNKSSNTGIETKQLIKQVIAKSKPGEPIIAASPWVFYEAIFYSSTEHPVYFIDATADYRYGSLDMLHYNDMHKIKDLTAFTNAHPTIWYIGYFEGDQTPAADGWQKVDATSVTNHVDGKTVYKGAEYQVPSTN